MNDLRWAFPAMVVGGTLAAIIGELFGARGITDVSVYCVLIGIIGSMFSGVLMK